MIMTLPRPLATMSDVSDRRSEDRPPGHGGIFSAYRRANDRRRHRHRAATVGIFSLVRSARSNYQIRDYDQAL